LLAAIGLGRLRGLRHWPHRQRSAVAVPVSVLALDDRIAAAPRGRYVPLPAALLRPPS